MISDRSKIEHAYTSERRLRKRLSSLAGLAAIYKPEERAGCIVLEATLVLDTVACVIQRFGGVRELETVAVRSPAEVSKEDLCRFASCLAKEFTGGHEQLVIKGLKARHPRERWLGGANLDSYLGLQFFGAGREPLGVVSVFSDNTREFSPEDGWWLKAAVQPVADALSQEALRAKLARLEQLLDQQANGRDASRGDEQPGHGSLSVLVIDDDRALNDVICEFLDMEGHQVEAAFDGVEAIRKFRPSAHDVILTDVAMPLMNGWELIAALRVRAPELPVVLITGYGSGNWNEEYLRKQGVVAVFSKPIDMDKLGRVLGGIATKKRNLAAA